MVSSALTASSLYLGHFARTRPELLTAAKDATATIIAPVYIDPSAVIDPSAKIGPNVSLGPNVRIGAGVRVKDAIVMEGSVLDKHSCVLNSIIGLNCKVGPWARIDGEPEADRPVKGHITTSVLATDVTVAHGILVRSCIVLPNVRPLLPATLTFQKSLSKSSANQVLL